MKKQIRKGAAKKYQLTADDLGKVVGRPLNVPPGVLKTIRRFMKENGFSKSELPAVLIAALFDKDGNIEVETKLNREQFQLFFKGALIRNIGIGEAVRDFIGTRLAMDALCGWSTAPNHE